MILVNTKKKNKAVCAQAHNKMLCSYQVNGIIFVYFALHCAFSLFDFEIVHTIKLN